MPYSGVMWVALPVACKRKEKQRPTQILWMKQRPQPPSYPHHTYTHTPTHTGEAVYTAHTSLSPLIHSPAKCGRYLFTVERVKFIEYSGLGQNQKFITRAAGLGLKVVRRGSDDTKGQLSLLKCLKSLPDILQIRCRGITPGVMEGCKAK